MDMDMDMYIWIHGWRPMWKLFNMLHVTRVIRGIGAGVVLDQLSNF